MYWILARYKEITRIANKKTSPQSTDYGLVEARRPPTLPTGRSVPSAPSGLTSLFGMGRGGSPTRGRRSI